MRLLHLDLDRYGPFTGRRLAFRPDARLHVVLGPNEAGKSCALAAVTDLLFGTRETRYEFLHRDAGLRIGAEVAARDGSTLTVFRRRGGRNTLADASGKPLPDDALAPFLGGITRTVFCNAFGLDALALRKGAEEMLRSEGEIGATLFAAASGLRGFRDAAQAFDTEAAALFTPTARKRKLNELIASHAEARTAARKASIGADSLRALDAGLEDATKRLADIADRRRRIAEEANRLRRLKAVGPILSVLDGLAAASGRFAGLPALDRSAIATLREAVQHAASATERVASARATLARAEEALAAAPPDEPLLPWLDAVEALVPKGGAYGKDARDLPRVQSEADGFEGELRALAVRLGFDGATDAEVRQPGDAALAGLKALLASGLDDAAERSRTERELGQLREERKTLLAGRGERAALVDPGPLRLEHEALHPVLAETGRRDDLKDELVRAAARIGRTAAALAPPLGIELERAASLLPSVEAATRHADAIADAVRDCDRRRDRIAEVEGDLAEVSGRMRSRQAAAAVPDREALVRLRGRRDEAWAELRGAFGRPDVADFLARTSSFERASLEADRAADRLIDDSERAADHAADGRRLQDRTEDAERLRAELARADGHLEAARAAWRGLWLPLAVAPTSPSEMTEWRGRVAGLLADAASLAEREVAFRALAERIEGIRPKLEALAGRLGVPGVSGLDVALIDRQVAERLRAAAESWEAARDMASRIAAAEQTIAAREAALAAMAERQAGWRQRWEQALAGCALPPGTGLEGAAAALEAWKDVPGLVRERNDRRRRVSGMRRDMAAYEAEVRRLAALVGMAGDRPPAELAQALAARAKAAREAAVDRTARLRSRDDAARLEDEATTGAERVAAALAAVRARFALPEADGDLAGFVALLEERALREDRVAAARDELARAGEGVPEAELRSGLAVHHADAIEGRLSQLASEMEQLDHDGRVAHSDRDRLNADRSRLEGGIGSEAATAKKGATEVAIQEMARRYVVLKLAALLLGAAVERHRAGQQDPLVARAGVLFSGLTGGAYHGLDQAFDERDQPVLAGRRSDGRQPVGVGDMSEGTRDQLFLALRLAYLEDYGERAEPPPFLGDDIFASFDDRRTEHGLAALAAIGSRVQAILFTHHEGVARSAERCLGSAVDVVSIA